MGVRFVLPRSLPHGTERGIAAQPRNTKSIDWLARL